MTDNFGSIRRHWPVLLVALTALADAGLVLPPTRYGAAFFLLWLLPGLAWSGCLTGRRRRLAAEEIAVGLALGIGTTMLLTLLFHYVPGPLSFPAFLLIVNLLILALAWFARPCPNCSDSDAGGRGDRAPTSPGAPVPVGHLLCVVLAGAFFRLINLGYSEFQGDEGIVMMRAARAILGDDAQLFYHQKGPAEVLLPLATWTLSGTINEWQARLPFALAGLLGVVALYLLGRRLMNRRVALIAALLLAINGYFVGFGRIVQYQSLVLAMTTLGLLALWRWSEGEGSRWLIAGAALLAFGLLAHYDAGLALPAAAYVLARRLRAVSVPVGSLRPLRATIVRLLIAGALAFGILALFYVPFACNPNFAKTLDYLSGARIGTAGPLYNNLLSWLPLATFYNSTYYLIGLACLLIVASFLSFRRLGLLIPATCYFLIVLQFAVNAGPISQSTNLPSMSASSLGLAGAVGVGPVLAALLIALLASRHSSPATRTAWLWFGVPFLFYYFLVWDPRTHVLNVFPAAVLLAAFALDRCLEAAARPPRTHDHITPSNRRLPASRQATAGCPHHVSRIRSRHCPHNLVTPLWIAVLAVFAFLAYYPYLMFVQHNPEIKRTWPAHQPALYWRPGHEVPLFGYFGFPYRAGWKVLGSLVDDGVLGGVYASNEEQEITDWYVRGAERTYCPDPEWYFLARDVQDEVPLRQADVESAYHLWGEIWSAGEPKLRIYHDEPPAGSPAVYYMEDYAPRFDARTTPASVLAAPSARYTQVSYTLGEQIELVGYRLDATDARPGGTVSLVLYWVALQPVHESYQVFNHLYDGTMWGQQDSTPGCALRPTMLWEPGRIVRDEYVIPIKPETPVGDVPLLVGMYSLDTGDRLPVRAPDGTPIGDAIPLTMVVVR